MSDHTKEQQEALARGHFFTTKMREAVAAGRIAIVESVVAATGEPALVVVTAVVSADKMLVAPMGMLSNVGPLLTDGKLNKVGEDQFEFVCRTLEDLTNLAPRIYLDDQQRPVLGVKFPGSDDHRVLVILPWSNEPTELWINPAEGLGQTRH